MPVLYLLTLKGWKAELICVDGYISRCFTCKKSK